MYRRQWSLCTVQFDVRWIEIENKDVTEHESLITFHNHQVIKVVLSVAVIGEFILLILLIYEISVLFQN